MQLNVILLEELEVAGSPLGSLALPAMGSSLILSRPQVQLGGFWLLLGRKCHYRAFWDMCHSCSL